VEYFVSSGGGAAVIVDVVGFGRLADGTGAAATGADIGGAIVGSATGLVPPTAAVFPDPALALDFGDPK
jgi:hypothetical protein